MIYYNFGRKCLISFEKFLSIKIKDKKLYKSDFKEFSELYELIDKNVNDVSHILQDNYEYYLENGVLHNLYNPALIKIHSENSSFYTPGTQSDWFYINGKLVCDDIKKPYRGCTKLENFENDEIFHFKELTNKKSGIDEKTGKRYLRKEGIDYKKNVLNLDKLRENDLRKQKLNELHKKR